MNWYNVDRVRQPGSVILNEWRAGRERSRAAVTNESYPLSSGERGSTLHGWLSESDVAGMHLTERTAMSVSAVYACVGIIAGTVSTLPMHIYRRTETGRDRVRDDPRWWLFNESPWANWTAADAWQYVLASKLLHGDGFARIHRASRLSPTVIGFEPIHPLRVTPDVVDGRLLYRVQPSDSDPYVLDQDDVLHFAGLGFDGERSMSPLRYAMRFAAGVALAADQSAASFFRNGARPDFALKTSGSLTPEAVSALRSTWSERHQGPERAHLPAVLTGGLEVQQLTLSAEDAQLIETRRFQVEDIARVFGVPPHMIGATDKTTSWGTGIEQQAIGFVKFTLQRHLVGIEQEINRKLWPRSLRVFAEWQRDALLDGDSKAQAEYFSKALGGPGTQGWMTVDEVRALKNLPPVGINTVASAGARPSTEDGNGDS